MTKIIEKQPISRVDLTDTHINFKNKFYYPNSGQLPSPKFLRLMGNCLTALCNPLDGTNKAPSNKHFLPSQVGIFGVVSSL